MDAKTEAASATAERPQNGRCVKRLFEPIRLSYPGVSTRMLKLDEVDARREKWAKYTRRFDQKIAKIAGDVESNDPAQRRWAEESSMQRRWMAEISAEILSHRLERINAGEFDDDEDLSESEKEALSESTYTSGFASFQKQMLFPVLFNLWPRLLAPEIVAVQPMPQNPAPIFKEKILQTDTAGKPPATTIEGHNNSYTADPGEGSTAAELEIQYTTDTITAIAKKVYGKYSAEAAQDADFNWNIRVDQRLIQAMTAKLATDIDLDILTQLLAGATFNDVTWDAYTTSTLPSEQREYRDTLFNALIDADAKVFARGYVNTTWILCNHTDAARFKKTTGFHVNAAAGASARGDAADVNIGPMPKYFGTLQEQWRVYVHPWIAAGTYLLGYKGANPVFDASFVYAPLVSGFVTPEVWDPATFTARRGVMSRYGRAMINNERLARVRVSNPSIA